MSKSPNNPDWTTVAVEKETRDRLSALGNVRDSYNSVIKMLIDYYTNEKAKPMENLPLGNQDSIAFKIKQ